jgi:hypothetical protein
MRAPQLVYTATACAALRAAAVRRLRPTRRLINMRGLDAFAAAADASWTRSLNADPESKQHEPNKSSRRVKSGHYVPVVPTALQSPELKLHSRELCEELGLTEADVKDERFARFFSGDVDALSLGATWATPYALSIMVPTQREMNLNLTRSRRWRPRDATSRRCRLHDHMRVDASRGCMTASVPHRASRRRATAPSARARATATGGPCRSARLL